MLEYMSNTLLCQTEVYHDFAISQQNHGDIKFTEEGSIRFAAQCLPVQASPLRIAKVSGVL